MQIYKILIIGAGPAGMMAGIRAGEAEPRPSRAGQLCPSVCLLERNNTPGRKLLISGKGRCNLTNAGALEDFLRCFGKNGNFLRDAFKALSNEQLTRFFSAAGLKLKTERGGRVFPADDRSASVLKVLQACLKRSKVKIIFGARVKEIRRKDNLWQVVAEGGSAFACEKIILATGGASYPATGSDGAGMVWAKELGHKIIPLRPGLVPLEIKEKFVRDLAGLSLKNVRVVLSQNKRKWVSEIGEMLFTHFGVSGPLVLEAGSMIADWFKDKQPITLSIDFKPALNPRQLNQRLLRDVENMGAKAYKNLLKELLPAKLIDVFIRLSGISAGKKANQITAGERRKIEELLKNFRLTVTASRPLREAIVTKGGVSVKEINPRTMESRIHKGLYFCGEIIDIDALTGGYNMQAAFSTGWLAGENAAGN